jgi:hypothetical protein
MIPTYEPLRCTCALESVFANALLTGEGHGARTSIVWCEQKLAKHSSLSHHALSLYLHMQVLLSSG